MGRPQIEMPEVLLPSTRNDLMQFFRMKTQIADAANALLRDGIDERERAYQQFALALEFGEVPSAVVEALDDLQFDITTHPRKYLPDAPPDDYDALRSWMKEFAPAKWWVDVLKTNKVGVADTTFLAWMSGRDLSKDRSKAVRKRLRKWWERLMQVVERVEDVQRARERLSFEPHRQTWFRRRVVEDKTMTVDEAREEWVRIDKLLNTSLHAINIADPRFVEDVRRDYIDHNASQVRLDRHIEGLDVVGQFSAYRIREKADEGIYPDGVEVWVERFDEDRSRARFDQVVADGWPQARSTLPPDDFEPGERVTLARWGGPKDEEGPVNRNVDLYWLWHRDLERHEWDRDAVGVRTTLIERTVSDDAENWRPATKREMQGWVREIDDFLRAAKTGEHTGSDWSKRWEAARYREKAALTMYRTGTQGVNGFSETKATDAIDAARREMVELIVEITPPEGRHEARREADQNILHRGY